MATLSGYTVPVGVYHVVGDISLSLDKEDAENYWLDDAFVNTPTEGCLLGTPDDGHLPIEFYSWGIAGKLAPSGSEWWKRGLSLLLRHI